MLRPQDVVVLLQLRTYALQQPSPVWTYAGLAGHTGLSASQGHASVDRLRSAGLVHSAAGEPLWVPAKALGELLLHAVPRWLYAESGPGPGPHRGVPTAWSTSPLREVLQSEVTMVWPHPSGEQLGAALAPLHPCVLRKGSCVPGDPRYNGRLHELLALVDTLRIGRARDKREAMSILREWGYAG